MCVLTVGMHEALAHQVVLRPASVDVRAWLANGTEGGILAGQAGDRLGHWTSPKAEQEFTALSNALRIEAAAALREQGWSTPLHESDVETRCGPTHIFHYQGTGVPMVFLHGAGTTSLMWYPLLGGLVGRSIYAIDVVGDPGLSVQRLPIRDQEDLAKWLGEVLDALDLDCVNLVGASYGGWIALTYAGRVPQRVAALILVEPVLDRLRGWFWVHGIAVAVAFVMPRPIARRALRRLHMNTDLLEDKRVRRYGLLGLTRYRRGLPKPVPVTNPELAAIAAPTLLLLGEHSEIHNSPTLIARARAAMPNISAELIAEAGHGLPVDKADEVARCVQSFLAATSGDTSQRED
jgi:pimeloyl-ACP methyl ester carboxylesterase